MTPGTEPFILKLDEVDSTNTWVREQFDTLPDLALVTAQFQTAGRGRLGRQWVAPRGKNFCGTFCFKSVPDGFHAGMLCGVALMETVKILFPDDDHFYLKWPNDLYYGKAKVAGLLGEGVIRKGKLAGVALGIGLNVNTSSEELDGVGQRATSLKIIARKEFNVDFITNLLAKSLNGCYIMYLNSVDTVFAKWRSCNRLIGRNIAVTDAAGKRWEGIFSDVTPEGEMVMEVVSAAGGMERKCFNCGDVSVDKSSI